jgi:chaperonin cofactor prefoldin
MSKRSLNKENLLKQKEDITIKIAVLQRTLKGIEKSLSKLDDEPTTLSSEPPVSSEKLTV